MKQEALRFFTDTHLTVIGLMIFFLFFTGVLFWVHRRTSSTLYNRLERLPLLDGDTHE